MDKKMKPRYLGLMIIIARLKGGSYVIVELDGSVFHQKVATFRVIPYFVRMEIEMLDNLEELINISKTTLKRIEETDKYEEEIFNRDFMFEGIKLTENLEEDSNENYSTGNWEI